MPIMTPENNHNTAVVFDFGGVLIGWDPFLLYGPHFNGDRAAMQRFLDEIGFAEWNALQDAGRPFAEGEAELTARFPQHAALIRAYRERFEETIAGPIQGSVEILRALKQQGRTLYGLSNWAAETFQRIQPNYPFLELLETIVLSGEVGLIKPDPRIFQLLLERTGRRAGDCLLIDDAPANIAAAAALGFQTIRFESPEQLRQELVQRGLLSSNGVKA